MGETTSGFVYVDVDGALPLVERAGGSLPPDAKDAVAAIDSFILQSERTATRHEGQRASSG